MVTYVHTLGDSTLDNYYWMLNSSGSNAKEAHQDSVEGQLQKKLGPSYQVVSHAYDGFTTSSVLDGDSIGRVLSIYPHKTKTAKQQAYLQNRQADPGASYFVAPLEDLTAAVQKEPDATHYVVVSVGGNDFRERLYAPHRLLLDIPQIHERYLRILHHVRNLKGRDIRPILMFQYPVDAQNDCYRIYTVLKIIGVAATCINIAGATACAASALALVTSKISLLWGITSFLLGAGLLALSRRFLPLSVASKILSGNAIGTTTLAGLMQKFYQPILAQAKKDNIPILDLPNTFNPHDRLYTCGIEPNKQGSQLIAEGISHIVQNYPCMSLLYFKNDDSGFIATGNQNPSTWQVQIPKQASH